MATGAVLSEHDGRDVLSLSQLQDSSLSKAPRATVIHSRERALRVLNRNELKTKTESL